MSDVAKIENLEEFIIEIKGQKVLLDADVAVIYGVETKRVNEAVKNNPGVFEIYECNLVRRENILRGGYTSRSHLVLKRI